MDAIVQWTPEQARQEEIEQEAVRRFENDRVKFLDCKLDLQLGTTASDEALAVLSRRFQHDGETAAQFPSERAQWHMDIRLIKLEELLPSEFTDNMGRQRDILKTLYRFPAADLEMLDKLNLIYVLSLAGGAALVEERFDWEITTRCVDAETFKASLRGPLPDLGMEPCFAYLNELSRRDFQEGSRKLFDCMASFKQLFNNFGRHWRTVLDKTRQIPEGVAPPEDLIHHVPSALHTPARASWRLLNVAVEDALKLWDRLKDEDNSHGDEQANGHGNGANGNGGEQAN